MKKYVVYMNNHGLLLRRKGNEIGGVYRLGDNDVMTILEPIPTWAGASPTPTSNSWAPAGCPTI